MLLTLSELQALRTLTADGRLLMLTRVVWLFVYGFLRQFPRRQVAGGAARDRSVTP